LFAKGSEDPDVCYILIASTWSDCALSTNKNSSFINTDVEFPYVFFYIVTDDGELA